MSDPPKLAEVGAFEEVQRELEYFKMQHSDVIEHLEHLIERHNTLLQAAEQACRSRGMSDGPFQLFSSYYKYKAEVLYDELGREDFLKVGGSIETISAYKLDKAKFEALAAQNIIPEPVVQAARELVMKYRAPDPKKL